MKNLVLFIIAGLSLLQSNAQVFPGLNTGNYSGVNGVFSNPANIADSRYRFDINLFSMSLSAANDKASFTIKNISSDFKGDSIRNKVFGKDAGPASGMFQLDFHGPSLMFNVGKNSFAVTTRARAMANIVDMDGKLFNKLSQGFSYDASLPYTISSSQNMRLAINAWSEYGVSYGRVITQKGPHFLKGGITLKYLAGAGNGYINIDQFNGTIDQDLIFQDVYLTNTTGRIATGFGGVSLDKFKTSDLMKMKGRGIGTDIGFIYEFRPGGSMLESKPYKFKFGASVLDLGSIKYKKDMQRSGAYKIDVTGGERLSLTELNKLSSDNYNDFFKSRPQYFTPDSTNLQTSYNVSLPTTFQWFADYHVVNGFYMNMGGQFSMSNNKTKGYNNRTYSGLTLTPRYELKKIGFYLPINYNQLTKLNAGAAVRVGPLFVGSGSIVSALLGKSKQADVFFGFRVGGLK